MKNGFHPARLLIIVKLTIIPLFVLYLYCPHFARGESPKPGGGPVLQDTRLTSTESESSFDQNQPAVARSSSGESILVWVDTREDDKGDIFGQRYSEEGRPLGWNFRINDDSDSSEQEAPAAAIGPDGIIWICWEDLRDGHADIYLQRFDKSGNRLGSNTRVYEDEGWQYQESPAIDLDGAGNAVIAWRDDREGLSVTYARKYHADGEPMGESFRVRDVGSNDHPPSIACHESGSFVVVWSGKRNSGYEVLAQIFREDTTPVGSTFIVRPDERIDCKPDVANTGNGFVVVWEDHRQFTSSVGQPGPSEIYGQRFFWDGSPKEGQFRISGESQITETQVSPVVIGLEQGDFLVSWEARQENVDQILFHLYASDGEEDGNIGIIHVDSHGSFEVDAAFDRKGNALFVWSDTRSGNRDILQCHLSGSTGLPGESFKVNDDGETILPLQHALLIHGVETFSVFWNGRESDSNGDIFGQRAALSGSLIGNPFIINNDLRGSVQRNPCAMNGEQSSVLVWEDHRSGFSQIFGMWFDTEGTPTTGNIQISGGGSMAGCWPAAAIHPSGETVIVWQEENGGRNRIVGCVRGIDGEEIFPPHIIHESDQNQFHPTVSTMAENGFFVAWTESDGVVQQVFGQLFDEGGSQIGQVIRISNLSNGIADFPQTTTTSSGQVLIVWQESLSTPQEQTIVGRWVSPSGILDSEPFPVNDDVGGGRHFSPDAASEGNDVVVVWCDERDRAGHPSIYAQRFRSDGSVNGSNFKVTRVDANASSAPRVEMSRGLIHTVWAESPDGHHGEVWVNVLDNSHENPSGFSYRLEQNRPNPFNGETTIEFRLTASAAIRLSIKNILGRTVRSLSRSEYPAGVHRLIWEGTDDLGRQAESGIYFVSLEVDQNKAETRKMVLVR